MTKSHRTRTYLNRWVSFAACCLIAASSGLAYSFSVFAPKLKDKFNFKEAQIAAIGSAFNLGGYLAIPSGLLYDKLERYKRQGPKIGIWIGCVVLVLGYGGLYACATDTMPATFSTVFFFAVLGGNASTWFDTSCIVTNVRNFPHDRGTVVGILKSFIGMSASIYSSAYLAYVAPDAVTFLKLLAIAPCCLNLVLSLFINLVPEAYHEPSPDPHARRRTQSLDANGFSAALLGDLQAGEKHQAQLQGQGQEEQDAHPAAANSQHAPRIGTQRRFAAIYCFVAVLVGYQTVATLYRALNPTGPPPRGVLTGILILLLVAGTSFVPWGSGDWLHRKPRAEALQRAISVLSDTAVPYDAAAFVAAVRSAGGTAHGANGYRTTNSSRGGAPESQDVLLPLLDAEARRQQQQQQGDEAGGAARAWSAGGAGAVRDMEAGSAAAGEAAPAALVEEVEAVLQELLEEIPALPNLGPRQALRTGIFWLLLLQFTVGLGTGLSYLNNLGSIVVALGGEPGGQVVFVCLFSVANATGRLLGGIVSEHLLHKYGTPRPRLFLWASVLMLVAVVGCTASALRGLYVISLVAGFAFGAHWSLVPSITSDLFGLDHFGANYTALQLGPAAGGYVLSTLLTGMLYDQAARRHGSGLYCIGADCYLQTWYILAALNIVAVVGSYQLLVRSRSTYTRIASNL